MITVNSPGGGTSAGSTATSTLGLGAGTFRWECRAQRAEICPTEEEQGVIHVSAFQGQESCVHSVKMLVALAKLRGKSRLATRDLDHRGSKPRGGRVASSDVLWS